MSEPALQQPTVADIEALGAFIKARVTPPHRKAAYKSEELRAFQALLDTVAVVTGSAEAAAKQGEYLGMQRLSLAVIARQWKEHPEFQVSWNR
ncbi:hypothetical protein [Streptomyces capuensis]|uniref:hypothetical protein n=1 Tax=Streptomyces capuensis TaxID=1464056 RepID=UPI00131B7621|nr:hypothetical protein [Streptomyces capuensis]